MSATFLALSFLFIATFMSVNADDLSCSLTQPYSTSQVALGRSFAVECVTAAGCAHAADPVRCFLYEKDWKSSSQALQTPFACVKDASNSAVHICEGKFPAFCGNYSESPCGLANDFTFHCDHLNGNCATTMSKTFPIETSEVEKVFIKDISTTNVEEICSQGDYQTGGNYNCRYVGLGSKALVRVEAAVAMAGRRIDVQAYRQVNFWLDDRVEFTDDETSDDFKGYAYLELPADHDGSNYFVQEFEVDVPESVKGSTIKFDSTTGVSRFYWRVTSDAAAPEHDHRFTESKHLFAVFADLNDVRSLGNNLFRSGSGGSGGAGDEDGDDDDSPTFAQIGVAVVIGFAVCCCCTLVALAVVVMMYRAKVAALGPGGGGGERRRYSSANYESGSRRGRRVSNPINPAPYAHRAPSRGRF